jgi:hypothetical protein
MPTDVMDATPYVPDTRSLRKLRAAAAECRGCPLHAPATQTVFGEGPPDAELMLVGEVPGDQEDRAGRVFVGPAGRELDRALGSAGIARDEVYITNAVKHFKFEERGKRRIHQKPEPLGGPRVPPVAARRARRRLTARARHPRRDGRTGADRPVVQTRRGARSADRLRSCRARHRDVAPVGDPARAQPRGPRGDARAA